MSEMDIPDRVVAEERLWRFKAMVIRVTPGTFLSFNNPVPVHTVGIGGRSKLIGCAVLYVEGGDIIADGVLDYATPERLDIETGQRQWWLTPVTKNGFIKELILDTQGLSRDHLSIGTPLL